MDPISRQRIERLLWQLDTTEAWLDQRIGPVASRPKLRALVASLRAYIVRCRRRVRTGQFTAADINHWAAKVRQVSVTLWEATRDE